MSGMSELEIVKYPAPVLRRPAQPLAAVDDAIRAKAREMFALMYKDRGVGLAAPQVGWSVRLFVMNPSGEPQDERAFVNPKIVARSKEKAKSNEGCLSLPEVNGKIERHVRVRIEALDLAGRPIEVDLEEFPARVAQHEIDHLDGVLIIDRMSLAEKTIAEKKLKELIRAYQARAAEPEQKVAGTR
jgi:peptide deformylase